MGSKTANTVPFNGTTEQETELLKVIKEKRMKRVP